MTLPFSKRSLPQPFVIIPLLLVMLWLSGCEESPIRRRTNPSNVDLVYQQIRTISPIELDRCRVLPGSPPAIAVTGNSASDAGGGLAAPASRDDQNSWENTLGDVEDKLFGGGADAGGAPAGSAAPDAIAPLESQPANQVMRANVLSREDINYATIQVDPNTLNTATMVTRGLANVVREVPRGNRIQVVEEDSVQVNLTYMLTKIGEWRCDGVYVETLPPSIEESPTPRSVGSGGRIGW